jgi:hypothetical protein
MLCDRVLAGWLGLILGNRAAVYFRDPGVLGATTIVFLLAASVLMEAAGFGESVQRPISIGVAFAAALILLIAAVSMSCRAWTRRGSVELSTQARAERAEALLEHAPGSETAPLEAVGEAYQAAGT